MAKKKKQKSVQKTRKKINIQQIIFVSIAVIMILSFLVTLVM